MAPCYCRYSVCRAPACAANELLNVLSKFAQHGADSRQISGRLPSTHPRVTVTIRRTKKLAASLRSTTASAPPPDTALGDWYANRVVVYRRPLILLISARSLLPIVLPARDVRTLPQRLADIVAQRLSRLPVDQRVIDAEVAEMHPVHVSNTADRSVVGIMVDFAHSIPYHLTPDSVDHSLVDLEDRLAATPCHATRAGSAVFPESRAPELLVARWAT